MISTDSFSNEWISQRSTGIAPQVVMKFTGHADYKSMKPYIDIAEKAKTDAMDAMEKALNG